VNLPRAIDGFERRLLAFGRLYDLLSRRSDRRYTSVGDYVGPLSLALAAAILEPRGIRCQATIGDGFLESKRKSGVALQTPKLSYTSDDDFLRKRAISQRVTK
jgi:hypothetical protein